MRKALMVTLLAIAGCGAPALTGPSFETQQWAPPGQQFVRRGDSQQGVVTYVATGRVRIVNERGRLVRAAAVRNVFEDARLTLYPNGRFVLGPEVGIPEIYYSGRWDRQRNQIVLRGRSTQGGEIRGTITIRGRRADLVARVQTPGGRALYIEQDLVQQPRGRFAGALPLPGRTGYIPGGWDIWIGDGDDED